MYRYKFANIRLEFTYLFMCCAVLLMQTFIAVDFAQRIVNNQAMAVIAGYKVLCGRTIRL